MMPETIQIDNGGCIYHQLSTPPLVDSSLLDVAGPHRCSWIGYSTLGMYKLLIVTARQQGEEDFLFCLSLWLCAGGGFADPLFSY